MNIREELRACANTQRVDVYQNTFSVSAFHVAGVFKYWLTDKFENLSNKDRATFLLLVAEAL